MHETKKPQETAVLIGLIHHQQDETKVKEYLDELAFLAETAGAKPIKQFTQKLEHPDPRTFLGKGKVNQVRDFVKENKVNIVIFDDELSPSQLRNIEQVLASPDLSKGEEIVNKNSVKCKVIDRNNLILDIFAARARTAAAQAQVELAQCEYMLPRLTGMWTHLERQKGGIGMRGPGETEIETDRRVIRKKISLLKEKLAIIDRQMATQRRNRGELVRVALVGYTNVGKSTVMNMLSKSEVFAENKLFATLDTTVRKVVFDTTPFLLSDTVGFIRKLPTTLVESFKSTLDEVREADILIHTVDISHPNFEEQIAVVRQTLTEINPAKRDDKPTILLFNKIDAYRFVQKEEDNLTERTKENMSLEDLKKSWMSTIDSPCVFISATNKENIIELKMVLNKMVREIHQKRYPNYIGQ